MRRALVITLLGLVAAVLAMGNLFPAAATRVRAQKVPPPTPVPPFGSPSPFPSTLETPSPSTQPPEIDAGSVALVDLDSGQVLFQRRAGKRRPIASTTKIMTALLVLEESKAGDVVTASGNAASQEGSVLGLREGEEITVRYLVSALLLQSANDAAVALAEHVAGSVPEFVDLMNARAREFGALDTHFESPNGLDDRGYSTARDLAVITVEAYRNETFVEVVSRPAVRIPSPDREPRHIQNRNALLWLYPGAIGVKTGFTSAAGFCLVGAAERDGLRLGTVVLGAPHEAFSDAAAFLSFGFETFEDRAVIVDGEVFGPVEVEGEELEVAAEESLDLLVRRTADIEEIVVLDPGLTLPLVAGERVGEVIVRAGDRELGSVPVVTMEEVRAPPEPPRPWWERTWEEVRTFLERIVEAILG
jgi:serine-type D-Ala-D-Ala carboxypeptidase (penicillin-binding protein 5/6)